MAADDNANGEVRSHERRSQARRLVDTPVTILLVNVAARLPGRILDLSLSGCRVHTNDRFPVGIYTRVEAEFELEGLTVRLGGVVQVIHDRRTIGIRFLDMSERKLEMLLQLMAEDSDPAEQQKVASI